MPKAGGATRPLKSLEGHHQAPPLRRFGAEGTLTLMRGMSASVAEPAGSRARCRPCGWSQGSRLLGGDAQVPTHKASQPFLQSQDALYKSMTRCHRAVTKRSLWGRCPPQREPYRSLMSVGGSCGLQNMDHLRGVLLPERYTWRQGAIRRRQRRW